MRGPRLKLHNCSAVYNCVCRVVGNQFLLEPEEEKEIVRVMIRRLADFCGVTIIDQTVMSNHFHVEVRVPAPGPVSDEELARRVCGLYPAVDPLRKAVQQDLEKRGHLAESLRRRLLARMGDISMYFKELKQRLTRSYNDRHERVGTLWTERFKSTLVEDCDTALRTVAAYLDLNALRAGLVDDPKDYRFCGYTEALAGVKEAREGLASCLPGETWPEQAQFYRQQLLYTAAVPGSAEKKCLSQAQIREKLKNEGILPLNELLRLRVRYFTDGAVLGSRAFVEEVFQKYRKHFGKRRKDGARPMKGADWGGLMVLRELRGDVFG